MAASMGLIQRPFCVSNSMTENIRKIPTSQSHSFFSVSRPSSSLTVAKYSISVSKVVGSYSEERRKKYLNLTVREKQELASDALDLGKKLKFQLVGKFGVTDNLVASFMEILEASEFLKVKVLKTCPDELDDVVKQLEEATNSVVVEQIGRTMIVYRPSPMKQIPGETQQELRDFRRREWKPRPVSGHGPRGASSGRM